MTQMPLTAAKKPNPIGILPQPKPVAATAVILPMPSVWARASILPTNCTSSQADAIPAGNATTIGIGDLKDGAAGSSDSLKRNRFVPYAGITYDITPKQSIYAAYTSIFKQTMNRDYNDNLLPPIMGRNYEIGWKGEWNEGRLNTSVALYRTDKDNNNQRVNAKPHPYWEPLNQSSRGLDAEISGSLTDRWQVYAGYTFNRSTNRNSVGNNVESRLKGYNFSSHTPKHMFRLYTSYVLPVDDGKWTVGLGLKSSSKTANSYGSIKQGGYTIWNTNVQYRPSKNLQLGLAVNNLTDKRYYENQYNRAANSDNFYGEPRNAVFSLKWKM